MTEVEKAVGKEETEAIKALIEGVGDLFKKKKKEEEE